MSSESHWSSVSVTDLVQLPQPCAICSVEIQAEEFNRADEVGPIALLGKQSTVAHSRHFFTDDGQPGPDYEKNLKALALIHGNAQGWFAHDSSTTE